MEPTTVVDTQSTEPPVAADQSAPPGDAGATEEAPVFIPPRITPKVFNSVIEVLRKHVGGKVGPAIKAGLQAVKDKEPGADGLTPEPESKKSKGKQPVRAFRATVVSDTLPLTEAEPPGEVSVALYNLMVEVSMMPGFLVDVGAALYPNATPGQMTIVDLRKALGFFAVAWDGFLRELRSIVYVSKLT